MNHKRLFLAALAAIVLAGTGSAQNAGGGRGRGFQLPPMINIKIAEFPDGGHIPAKFTCAAGQGSPSFAMTCTGAPATTQSYVAILHDPDPVLGGSATNDVLHWAIFDIPGDAKGLPEGVKNGEQADGSKHIKNIAGGPGYMGPCPPAGHGDHHYILEVFALSAKLGLPDTTSRADLMSAMNGKVVAKGLYVGLFGQK